MIALKPGMRRVRNLSSARPVRRGDCACAQFCCRGIGNGDSSHRRLRLSKFSPPGPFFIRACALISKRAWRWCTSERKRGKLLRDKIPATIAAGGETVIEAKLAKADLHLGLAGKLIEEMEEFLRASDAQEQAAEIADMLEVIKGLAAASGHSWAKIDRIAKEKAGKRGGFKDGRVLIETALPHRDSPLERQEQVRASDLGSVECNETQADIPASALVATANGPGIIFSYEEDPARYRVSIKNGNIQIVQVDPAVPKPQSEQGDLFTQ